MTASLPFDPLICLYCVVPPSPLRGNKDEASPHFALNSWTSMRSGPQLTHKRLACHEWYTWTKFRFQDLKKKIYVRENSCGKVLISQQAMKRCIGEDSKNNLEEVQLNTEFNWKFSAKEDTYFWNYHINTLYSWDKEVFF